MFDRLFQPPIIGPFVEPNGRDEEARHIGARVTWTSAGEVYRFDVIRKNCSLWHHGLGFEQAPEMDFEDFCWYCFQHSSRLRDFLNELRPFFRPSSGAPTNAGAGEWLHPTLVAHDFAIGIAKFHKTFLRVPLVWVFGGNAGRFGSRTVYTKVGSFDWSPNGLLTVEWTNGWGTASAALRRLFSQLVNSIGARSLLTEKGVARMQELYLNGLKRAKPARLVRLTADDKVIGARLRRKLATTLQLGEEAGGDVEQLSDKAYAGVLRTCLTEKNEEATCALLRCRRLPKYGRTNLLERFIQLAWRKVWKHCAEEAAPFFTTESWRCNGEIIRLLLQQGLPQLLAAVLESLPTISPHVVEHLLRDSLENGREDLARTIMDAPVAKPFVEQSLVACFTHGLSAHYGPLLCKQPNLSMYLLEKGVRPIRAIKEDDFLDLRRGLLEPENLPILKRAIEFDPPTQESITALVVPDLGTAFTERTATLDYLVAISRALPGHKERLTQVAFRAAVHFIWNGESTVLSIIRFMLEEGATLADVPATEFTRRRILAGRDREAQQGNWIDLIGHLTRWGFPADAEILKRLNPT